jgi:hypothetical protein
MSQTDTPAFTTGSAIGGRIPYELCSKKIHCFGLPFFAKMKDTLNKE